MRVRIPSESVIFREFFLFVSCSHCCTYNILFNINLYRWLKMHIRNYFQIIKIDIYFIIESQYIDFFIIIFECRGGLYVQAIHFLTFWFHTQVFSDDLNVDQRITRQCYTSRHPTTIPIKTMDVKVFQIFIDWILILSTEAKILISFCATFHHRTIFCQLEH